MGSANYCSVITAGDKPELFEAYALPAVIIGVIVIALILRAGRNSPPAVNQLTLKARERFRLRFEGQQIRCNSGADG
jgi:BioD-like phosphotransacetylase family protein